MISLANIIPPPAPIIAEGAGETLADPWVEKLVSQWLEVLYHDYQVSHERFLAFLDSPYGRLGGNPKAQERWVRRASAAYGDGLLDIKFAAQSRARVLTIIDRWAPMSATLSEAEKLRHKANCTPSRLAWLYGMRMHVLKAGVHSRTETDFAIVAALSKHALVRMVQRGNCTTARDLSASLKMMWRIIAVVHLLTAERRNKCLGDSWLIPVFISTQETPVILVASGPTADEANDLFYVKTVLRFDMLRDVQVQNILNLLMLVAHNSPMKVISDLRSQALDALEACRVAGPMS